MWLVLVSPEMCHHTQTMLGIQLVSLHLLQFHAYFKILKQKNHGIPKLYIYALKICPSRFETATAKYHRLGGIDNRNGLLPSLKAVMDQGAA